MSRWSPEFASLLKKRVAHMRGAGEHIAMGWRVERMNFHLARECGRTTGMLRRAMAEDRVVDRVVVRALAELYRAWRGPVGVSRG